MKNRKPEPFTEEELLEIRDNYGTSSDIRNKINKYLEIPEEDLNYTLVYHKNWRKAKKFPNSGAVRKFIENKVGPWSVKNAKKWREYKCYDVEDGVVEYGGYTF